MTDQLIGVQAPDGAATDAGASYVVAREDDFDFLSPAYRALHQRSTGTLFQDPVWLDRLYTTLAPRRGARRLVITVRVAGPASEAPLVGVLPLVRRRRLGIRRVEYADLGVCDYAAPVLDRSHAAAVLADASVRRGVRSALGPFDLLQVERVAGSGAEMATLLGAGMTRRHSYHAHSFPLPSSPSSWPGEVLSASMLRRLADKRRRLRPKGGATLRLVTDVHEVAAVMERLRDYRQARFAGRRAVDLVQHPDFFEFYRRAAVDGIAGGGPARLYSLDVGGETAAVGLDLVDDDRHVAVLIGYDTGRLRNCSLGLVLVEEQVRLAIAEGRRTFDQGVGDEPYKADFGARPTPMHVVRAAVTVRGRAAAAAADLEAIGRRTAKRVLAAQARLVETARSSRRAVATLIR